jgi:hypothetical protein
LLLAIGFSGCGKKDKNYYNTNKKAAIEKYEKCNESKDSSSECLIAYDVLSELLSSAKKKFRECEKAGEYENERISEECAEAKSNASNLSDILGLADTTDNKGIGY